ncbi:hypothetical protein [Ornithinimicrobium panacihumi]|uniref:hypothetical protein n=1 Tax=Ornithinimicrobium panacihumi TaxID=2008449 RepID=UPI003F8A3656
MGWIDLVGWAGSAILVISLLQTRVLRLRLINLIGSLVLLVFNTVIQVWPMVGLNAVLCLINIYFLWRLISERHDDAAYTVLQVGPQDAYLRHVLHVHRADIARYNPGFDADLPDDVVPFLVQRGDETVGVVLVRDAGGGTAEVMLDWVTPRHRDFSPGEFVYRQSGLFRERGFERVLSPAGMKDPYYSRIGFRPHGERWVLEV